MRTNNWWKNLICFSIVGLAVCLLSWGSVGHKTIAEIAEKHLTPQAKAAVTALLGSESLTDVANWADQVRDQPEYKHTAPWHYLNVPDGLNYNQFTAEVKGQTTENVYSAILKCEEQLSGNTATKEEKAAALKFLVHFIGDIHQPMHVSRASDKGGNTVQVQFDGRGTNLHALWDSRLIDHQRLSYSELAKTDDQVTPDEILKWQKSGPMRWAFESYQISAKLYKEIEQNNKLTDQYYADHIGIINQRLEMAGIRLATVLNEVFSKSPILPTNIVYRPVVSPSIPKQIDIKDVSGNVGNSVTVSGQVFGSKTFENMVLINLGAAYPNQPLTVVLKGDCIKLADEISDKTITVIGKVELYKGKPEIVITDRKQITY